MGDVDVAVVGAGPAGAATAIVLAGAGYDIALFERRTRWNRKVGEALPPETRVPLEALGLWEAFLGQGPLASEGVTSIWGTATPVTRNFIARPYQRGFHIDRVAFDTLLREAAASAGAEVIVGARVCDVQRRGGGLEVHLDGQKAATRLARFVVDATGRHRSVARSLGARAVTRDRMVGLVGYVADAATARTLLIEATEHGWWYTAPLPGGSAVATLMTDPDLVDVGAAARARHWRTQLGRTTAVGHRLGVARPNGAVRSAAAGTSRLDPVCDGDWIAVGDAACAYDPLAGRGIDQALRSALRGAEAVSAALCGNREPLARYARMQRETFADFLARRRQHYMTERRWPHSPFWSRRWRPT